ncbi:splicing factor 3a subunit [Piedraia hortae CBS 480.64]|uniref:Splicing factor 3a subunit n=1 Tax=Piedraia hortae CBS 480.64 TaxID=1314780 RepID=A0A6A7BVT1_9PEZI|nr:splicing factor 3a subunit [Piedraia hortae CBS 480.64]
MLYEDLRYIHEDVERLEQAITDWVREDPKRVRRRLVRDHAIARLLDRVQAQSAKGLQYYNEQQHALAQEVQSLSVGDSFAEFYRQVAPIKDFNRRYPNEPVENLETAYNFYREPEFAQQVEAMFTGEESFGRYLDLTILHEEYLNLPGVKGIRKLTYLQYLDAFDVFVRPQCPVTRETKMTEPYFAYVNGLATYLEGFYRKTRPLEDTDKVIRMFDQEFDELWEKDAVPGWEKKVATETEGSGQGIWCAPCGKEFSNENVYTSHLKGKKHIRNAQQSGENAAAALLGSGKRLKERVVAEREHRVRKLSAAMPTQREDTRVNVERKAGMTDRERQQELEALYNEDDESGEEPEAEEEDGEEKIYNPLKLPLSWDGKPIPFWLYKLHGLGNEFPCEICGNYVYMGRRAFEKHFSEPRHIYGLKCLGITQTSVFREITGIEEAARLWEKVKKDKIAEAARKQGGDAVEEMEDAQGNVMPKKVYMDLKKAHML